VEEETQSEIFIKEIFNKEIFIRETFIQEISNKEIAYLVHQRYSEKLWSRVKLIMLNE
jgi:hypothetical protein